MFTRGVPQWMYEPGHLAPWHMPTMEPPRVVPTGEGGPRMSARGRAGAWPGYGPHPISGEFTELRLDRGPMNEVAPGFGYALDPSDPATWRGRTQVFTR